MQLEEEEAPSSAGFAAFKALRSEEFLMTKTVLSRMATMIVWSPELGGVVKMSDTAGPKIRKRSKTMQPIRKKTPIARFTSLREPSSQSSSNTASMDL